MKKLKTLLTTTFKGFSGKKFNPRRYLEMADIELEHDREGVHYRLADRVDIVALLAIERDVYNGDIPWTFSHFEHEIVKNDAICCFRFFKGFCYFTTRFRLYKKLFEITGITFGK